MFCIKSREDICYVIDERSGLIRFFTATGILENHHESRDAVRRMRQLEEGRAHQKKQISLGTIRKCNMQLSIGSSSHKEML